MTQMSEIKFNNYLIWLMPKRSSSLFSSITSLAAKNLGAAKIDPHVTLLCTIPLEQDLKPFLKLIMRILREESYHEGKIVKELSLTLKPPVVDPSLQGIIQPVAPAPELVALRLGLARYLVLDPFSEFHPHLSLIYKTAEKYKLQVIVDELGEAEAQGKEEVFDQVWVVRAVGGPVEWKVEGKFELDGTIKYVPEGL